MIAPYINDTKPCLVNLSGNNVSQVNKAVYISQLGTTYTTDSEGNITLEGEVGTRLGPYTFYTDNETYKSSDIYGTILVSGSTSTTTVNLTFITFTVSLTGTDTNRQKLTMVYSGTTYINSANITVPKYASLTISSIGILPYTGGFIYINGTNTGSSSYTISSLTGNVVITNASAYYYHECDSSSCGGEGG